MDINGKSNSKNSSVKKNKKKSVQSSVKVDNIIDSGTDNKIEYRTEYKIDLNRTGMKLKRMLTDAGYSVRYIQKYLNLTCTQSVYRWYSGYALPTVDHLYSLSRLLGINMEEFLVFDKTDDFFQKMDNNMRLIEEAVTQKNNVTPEEKSFSRCLSLFRYYDQYKKLR